MSGVYSNCTGDNSTKNRCKARIDLFNHLMINTNLKDFLYDETGVIPSNTNFDSQLVFDRHIPISGNTTTTGTTTTETPNTTPVDLVPANPIGIRIPTNFANQLNKNSRSYYTTNDKAITFEIAKVYTNSESIKIYKAIYNSICNSNSCRAGIGSKIIFDQYGNIELDVNNNKGASGSEWFANDRLNNSLKTEVDGTNFTSNSLDTNSYAIEYANIGIWDVSIKFLMNQAGTFIIYTPFKKEKLTTSTPPANIQYYLLVNPVHRPEFQKFYRLLLEIKNPSQNVNRDISSDPTGGYMNPTEVTPLCGNDGTETCAPVSGTDAPLKFTIESYTHIMARYCNAFKIKSHPLPNGRKSEIYMDPVCSLALNPETADIAFILGQNYTQECLSYDFWAKERARTDSVSLQDCKNGQEALRVHIPGWEMGTITDATPRWACKTHVSQTHPTAIKWLDAVAGQFRNNSDSFINVLANSYINRDGTNFVDTNNQHNINYTLNGSNLIPMCKQLRGGNVVICSTTMEFNGDADVSNNEINFINACNGEGTDTPPSGSTIAKILTFGVSIPDENNLIDSYAAELIPIFEGGTGKITAEPELKNSRDIAAIKNNVISGRPITIREVTEPTVFTLQVKSSGTTPTTATENITIPTINNKLPEEEGWFSSTVLLFILAAVIIAAFFLFKR
jgi:hypothetical protein